jgi:hypothetical protein
LKSSGPELKLAALHEQFERVSASLVDLEIDSGRQLLEATPLEGQSAARWAAASAALNELWRRHALLEELLAKADTLRGSRRGDLRALVDGPSIVLAGPDRPLASGSGPARCSPEALLAGLAAGHDEVKAVVVAIGRAWETLRPLVEQARRTHSECASLADELGEATLDGLVTAAGELEAISRAVTSDPLSVSGDRVDAVLAALRRARVDLEAVAALKRGFAGQMLDARMLLDRLRDTGDEAQGAHAELLIKVTNPGPAPPADPVGGLTAELEDIAQLAGRGRWRPARQRLDDWTARATAALEAARAALAAGRAPLEARNQLRALLDAYEVKAQRLGVLEHPEVAGVFAAARECLYTSPTDVAAAAQLVRGYQQAIDAASRAPEPTP